MYNSEIKERFIGDYTSSTKTAHFIRTLFNRIEPYEVEWGEDVALRSSEELQPVVNSQTGTRMQSAERTLVVLREYVKWRKRNGERCSNGIFDVKVDTIEAIRNHMIANPKDLKEKLDRVFDPVNWNTIDCVYRSYIWLLYAGLKNEEALDVEIDQIDFDDMKIRYNDKICIIYEEAKEALAQACTSTAFSYTHTNPPYKILRNRGLGRKVTRGFSEKTKISTIKSVLSKRPAESAAKDINLPPVKLSYKKIFYSGMFYRTYLGEINGNGVDFSDYIAGEVVRIQKNNPSLTYEDLLRDARHIKRELELDYEKWKCVFGV